LKARKNINVSSSTYEKLTQRGEFGESFDGLLNRILDVLDSRDKKEGKSKK
jgi:hypothetical protein